MSYLDRDMLGMYRNDTGPGPALMGADTLIGDDVYNHDDEQLGDIKEIILDHLAPPVAARRAVRRPVFRVVRRVLRHAAAQGFDHTLNVGFQLLCTDRRPG